MADVTLKYKGSTIGELSESGNKTIETAGKYCEADILLEYLKPQGGIVNLLDVVNYYSGYIAADGGFITYPGQVTKGEIYTDLFDVTSSDMFVFCEYQSAQQPWFAIASYDADGNFIARNSVSFTTYLDSACGHFIIPQNAKKIRFTFRSYNNSNVMLCDYNEINWRAIN